MSEDPPKPIAVPFIDNDNVPTHIVNSVTHVGYFGSLFDVVLATGRTGIAADGTIQNRLIVCARLRFDLEMARMIRDQLDGVLNALTAPPKDQQN